ncbi:MAG: tRNA glutamyl-Q(34) synthetase GluQRS [Desulfovibrio sp.]|uniref:tRNA glutamyl-Q(34) synthetase GluQRS n=1 Tax=Desulfovibrio sp. 7SRBS1 TaxID=3378064 RepID=UPI003B3BF964
MSTIRGRFAPSPTGRMHLGNAFASLLCWLAARSRRGEVVFRVEDIDPQRSRTEYVDLLLQDLEWLGLDWDEGPDKGGSCGPYVQSRRLERYEAVLNTLQERRLVYPCWCTRRELQEAARNGPQPARRNAGPAYPGFCRDLSDEERRARMAGGRTPVLRLLFPERDYEFTDLNLGHVLLSGAEIYGDFSLRRSDGVFAYQLAVVVDDVDMHITQVVRGADILDSTPRQMRLLELLGKPLPEYAHVPLLVDGGGKKLSKTHASLELAALRGAGVRPENIVGYLLWLAGLQQAPRPARAGDFVDNFDFGPVPLQSIVIADNVADILAGMGR